MIIRRSLVVFSVVAIPLSLGLFAADQNERYPYAVPSRAVRARLAVSGPNAPCRVRPGVADGATTVLSREAGNEPPWKGTVTMMRMSAQHGVNPGNRTPWTIESKDSMTCTVAGPHGEATCSASTKYAMSAADGTFLTKEGVGTDDAIVTVSLTAKGTVVEVSAVHVKGTMKTPWGGGSEELSLGPFSAEGPPTADSKHTKGSWSLQPSPELLKTYDTLKLTITWDLSRQ